MAKPTEGPYTVAHRPDFGAHYIIAADGKVLFRLEYADGDIADREQKAATARLLAKSWEMRANLDALEKAEHAHANCDECLGEDMPELCPECFPLFDAVRVQRRALLREIDGDSQ